MSDKSWKRTAYSIAAVRARAQRVLPRSVFDFADGGADDERTLARNEAAFAELDLLPRPLNGAATRDLTVTLFGKVLSLPLMIGPTGLSGLLWPGGEQAAARAAVAAGTAFCLSHGSVCTIEELAKTEAHPRWMQVFIYTERSFTEELTRRAEAAGYDALVLTVDNQLLGNRERDLRNGFTIPPRFGAADAVAMLGNLPWLFRMRTELPRLTFANYARPGESNDMSTLARRMASLLDPGMNWRDVEWLRRIWKGPLLIKGILHPAEAKRAVEAGVDGVIVSNHGGRQLDGAISSIEALPGIVSAVGQRIPVLVDGGIRRGSDVVKALALGASCCLVGRPQLFGLAVAGEAGVAHVLEIYRREIDRVMGLMGARRIADLDAGLLSRRVRPEGAQRDA